jgi:penicillin-binding protein 1A
MSKRWHLPLAIPLWIAADGLFLWWIRRLSADLDLPPWLPEWMVFWPAVIGLLALHLAYFLAFPPEAIMAFRRRFLGPASDARWVEHLWMLRLAAWIAGICGIAAWLHVTLDALIWKNWAPLPLPGLESRHVGLAWLPVAWFALFALLARPPRLRTACRKRMDRQSDGRLASRPLRWTFRRLIWTTMACLPIIGVFAFDRISQRFLAMQPDDLSAVELYRSPVTTVVYANDGRTKIGEFKMENRLYVSIERIPAHVRDAFIAAEDQRFHEHYGFDVKSMGRAFLANRESGQTRQGASTITQQVVKLLILKNREKSVERKAAEALLAVKLERQLTAKHGRRRAKELILEAYLNEVSFGANAYGIEAAAQTYFGKHVEHLTVAEAALLAGLPKAPSAYSPPFEGWDDPETLRRWERAKVRQRYVLGRMLELGAIDQEEYRAAVAEQLTLERRDHELNGTAAPYLVEHVRRFLQKRFGVDHVFEGGLEVTTTVDYGMQMQAQWAVPMGLLDLERRIGFHGPEGRVDDTGCPAPAKPVSDHTLEPNAHVVSIDRKSIEVCVRGNRFPLHPDDVGRVHAWERKSGERLVVGDVFTVRILTVAEEGEPSVRYALTAQRMDGEDHPEALQAALVAVEPRTGHVLALVGGYAWSGSQFNLATQAERQTGSSIKPLIYEAAMEKGRTVDSIVLDAPITLPSATGPWSPHNYKGAHTRRQYWGSVDLKTALAQSLNSASVRLLVEAGLDFTIGVLRRLGYSTPIDRVYPLAVGSEEVRLWEHTMAYASLLANGRAMPEQPGSGIPGVFITKVVEKVRGPDGRIEEHVLFEYRPEAPRQAVPAGDAYAVTYLMKGVVESGTGKKAQRLRRVVAGKTGTTDDFQDAWFMAGTPDIVTGVWVGRMTPEPIAGKGEATGGAVALPIWLGFMQAAHANIPAREFPVPDDVCLVLDSDGELVPFQRGRTPDSYLSGVSDDFDGPPFE